MPSSRQPLFGPGGDDLELHAEVHRQQEERFVGIDPISAGPVLVVWTERDDDAARVISGRWATERELSQSRFGGQR